MHSIRIPHVLDPPVRTRPSATSAIGSGHRIFRTPSAPTPRKSAPCGNPFRRFVLSYSPRPYCLYAPYLTGPAEFFVSESLPGLLLRGFQVTRSTHATTGYEYARTRNWADGTFTRWYSSRSRRARRSSFPVGLVLFHRIVLREQRRRHCPVESGALAFSVECLAFQSGGQVDATENPIDQPGQFGRRSAAMEIRIVGRGARSGLTHDRAGGDAGLLGGLENGIPFVFRGPDGALEAPDRHRCLSGSSLMRRCARRRPADFRRSTGR